MSTSAETMREIAELLFEGGAFEYDRVAKANPDAADLSTRAKKKQTERRQAQIGFASNVVGLGAAVAGTKDTYGHFKRVKSAKVGQTIDNPIKVSRGTKWLAGGALGLQVANLGGDAVANRVLARAAKKDPDVKGGTQTAVRHAKKAVVDDKFGKRFTPVEITKSAEDDSITWEGEFSKIDADKRQVFGWASIVKKNGEDVVDLQGDYISVEEIEKAAYDYVIKSRKGGRQHERQGEEPLHVSDMIESFIVTPEKVEKMGLPADTPLGWWVGYQINDDDTWQAVKEGRMTGFSIHGRGQRKELV